MDPTGERNGLLQVREKREVELFFNAFAHPVCSVQHQMQATCCITLNLNCLPSITQPTFSLSTLT